MRAAYDEIYLTPWAVLRVGDIIFGARDVA
jgi:hypothetical protein